MKGAGFAWIFGLLMVLLVVAVFAVGVVSHYNVQVSIITGAVEAYDTVNVGEFAKRSLDGAAFTSASIAVDELLRDGGGYSRWTDDSPSIEELETKLSEEITTKMNEPGITGLTRRELTWGQASAVVTAHDDDYFKFTGNRHFTVENSISTPNMFMESEGAFGKRMSSSYFKLLRLGRAAVVCPASEGDSIVEEFALSVKNVSTETENLYSVDVSDPAGPKLTFTFGCPSAQSGEFAGP
ncbi:MAG: hypothetical protein V1887_00930 [Candidatus Aenigmatarchaeota archaeon]